MKRTLCSLATVIGMVLALPALADLNAAPAKVPGALGHVVGHVALMNPDTLWVSTATGLERFDITPRSKGENDLGTGDYVEIWYANVPGSTHKVAVQWHRTAEAQKQRPAQQQKQQPAAKESRSKTTAENSARPAPAVAQESPRPAVQRPVLANTQHPRQATPPPPAQPTSAQGMRPSVSRLPQTASQLPLVGVVGLVSLAGAGAIRLPRG